jgi:prepilin-type N-terminal cleavage/methylation domain-containing protein
MRQFRTRSRGFTLIEALAAIAIMALVIPVLLRGFVLASKISQRVRHQAEATAVAQSCLDEIIATKSTGGTTGQTVLNDTVYNFAIVEEPYENEVDIEQETATVTWTTSGKEDSVTLTTLIFIPESTVQSTTPLSGGLGGGQP